MRHGERIVAGHRCRSQSTLPPCPDQAVGPDGNPDPDDHRPDDDVAEAKHHLRLLCCQEVGDDAQDREDREVAPSESCSRHDQRRGEQDPDEAAGDLALRPVLAAFSRVPPRDGEVQDEETEQNELVHVVFSSQRCVNYPFG